MGSVVVKLGSSIVADDRGEVRTDVLSRICDELAELHRAGRQPVVVTSGAIARGMGVMALPAAPARDGRAPGGERGRAGQALPGLRRAAARAGNADRTGAADVLRHERAHALPERPPDAPQAARVAGGPGDQRERHDHDRRDLIRRQRLPGRAGRDPARGRAAAAADRRRGRVHRRSAHRPGGPAGRRGEGVRGARRARDRTRHIAARLRRDAIEGRRGRDGDRGRDPDGDRQRAAAGRGAGARPPAIRSAPGSPPAPGAIRASSCG